MLLEFDAIETWESELGNVLGRILDPQMINGLQSAQPNYVEDARDHVLTADRDRVFDAVLDWIGKNELVAFHGTRLLREDVASIKRHGLIPLTATHRSKRLTRALSQHPRWREVEGRLPEVLEQMGEGMQTGRREGQVHLTLSRAGLEQGFNHYLTHGSEFDQNAAHLLLDDDGVALLGEDGEAMIVRVHVPGAEALAAAHPYFSVDDVRRSGEIPNIVRHFIEAWAFRQSHPTWEPASLEVDCGLVFNKPVPANWIADVTGLNGNT